MKDHSESDVTLDSVPRSPTTGALISNNDAEMFGQDEIPEHNELTLMSHTHVHDEKKLSQNTGSQSSQESMKNAKLTVRERTERWEARGGGVPSYFSTLPKSFRHKATDRRKEPAYAQYFDQEDEQEMEEMMGYGYGSSNHGNANRPPRSSTGSRSQQSGIPLPNSKLRISSSHSRGSGGKYDSHQVSMSPDSQGNHKRMYSADDGIHSLNSSGQSHSSNDNSLERRLEDGQEVLSPMRGSSNVKGGRHTGSQVRHDL